MKIPTFVSSLDSIIKGGMPIGTSALLMGDPGAGNFEFAITSASKHALAIEGKLPLELEGRDVKPLNGILYVTISKPQKEIQRSFRLIMDEALVNALESHISYVDLSGIYYSRSQIPASWIGKSTLKDKEDFITVLFKSLEEKGRGKLIIIDSLTDLFTWRDFDFNKILDLSRGVTRVVKEWDSVAYTLMTRNITDPKNENILIEIFDGAMVFRWSESENISKRFRYMYMPKFIGVLQFIEKERIEKFDTQFDYNTGMVILNITRVR